LVEAAGMEANLLDLSMVTRRITPICLALRRSVASEAPTMAVDRTER
jgi:hypothetical protein